MASEPTTRCKSLGIDPAATSYSVRVAAKGTTHEFACVEGERILYAGLRAGVALAYECASGTCGTCKASLVSGETAYAWPEAPGRKYAKETRHEVLTCQSVAHSSVELQIANFNDPNRPRFVPRYLRGRFARTKKLTDDVMAFGVLLDEPIAFEAGQFVLLEVDDVMGARSYSMVNFEPETNDLQFLVKRLPGGKFTEWVFAQGDRLEGQPVRVFGPLGRATFDPSTIRHVVCIAGGSGIAGMMSILAHAAREDHFAVHDARVYFGVRTAQDAFYLEELREHARRFPGKVRIVIGLSHEEPSDDVRARHPELEFDQGFIHDVAKRSLGAAPADTMVYVAGPPPMVEAALRMLLLEMKHSGTAIRYDKFS